MVTFLTSHAKKYYAIADLACRYQLSPEKGAAFSHGDHPEKHQKKVLCHRPVLVNIIPLPTNEPMKTDVLPLLKSLLT